MSDLVGNPVDRFPYVAAHIISSVISRLLTGAARYPTVIGLFLSPENKSYGPLVLVILLTVSSAKLLKLYVPGPSFDP